MFLPLSSVVPHRDAIMELVRLKPHDAGTTLQWSDCLYRNIFSSSDVDASYVMVVLRVDRRIRTQTCLQKYSCRAAAAPNTKVAAETSLLGVTDQRETSGSSSPLLEVGKLVKDETS